MAYRTEVETQTVVLQALRQAQRLRTRGGWVSAPEAATTARVTLNAVHQAIHRLRAAGWDVITSDRQRPGDLSYRLADQPTPPPPAPLTPPPRVASPQPQAATEAATGPTDLVDRWGQPYADPACYPPLPGDED